MGRPAWRKQKQVPHRRLAAVRNDRDVGLSALKFVIFYADQGEEGPEDEIVSQAATGRKPSQTQETHRASAAVEHVVDPDRKRVIVKFGHRVSVRDIARYALLLKANPKFRAEFSEIVDLTEVKEFELGGDDFMKLADEVDPFAAEARRAFVAKSSVQKHAARMHKILRVNRNIEIFSSVEAAERWVGE